MPKYTDNEVNQFINDSDAQQNDSGSITWALNNKYNKKPGTFLRRPPGAAPLITEETGADMVAKKWEPYENMEAFERWRFRQTHLPEQARGKLKPGYIYFIQAVEEPFYIKIGCSVEPCKRLNAIQTASPIKLEPLAIVSVPHINQFEKLFHEYFVKKRVRGEWFDIEPRDVYELLNKFWKETE